MSESARYWHRLDANRIQCDLCPRHCRLRDGQRGLCFVRKNEHHRMVLTTYGRSSGFCVDPIEKKPLNHFLPGSGILSFGTAGCNLTCSFCQNWDMSRSRKTDRMQVQASPEKIARMALQNNCPSVACTYNDPIIFLEYAVDIAAACRDAGLKTVAVTNGYITPEAGLEFFSAMDAVNIDLKGFNPSFYRKLCSAELQPVLESIKAVHHETDTWLEITNLLIPGENDTEAEIDAMTDWILDNLGADVPIHFSAFHPAYKMRSKPRTPDSTLHRARRQALDKGIHFAYTGNIYDPEGASTRCPECGATLLLRHVYQTSYENLDSNGRCRICGSICPGVFQTDS